MPVILDDNSVLQINRRRVEYYFLFGCFILLLMNGGAYLQLEEEIKFTPIFEQYAGQFSTLLLLLSTTLCYRKIAPKASWLKTLIIGLSTMLSSFTIIFQIVQQLEVQKTNQLFPFWTYISIGYIVIAIFIMETIIRQTASQKE